ncbi:MAG: circadian clock KaiB family protein [Candidatus Anammoxibacter sp.]
MSKIDLKLFIANWNETTDNLVKQLNNILRKLYNRNYNLEVLDIFTNSKQAEIENIIATPTLLKKSPLPEVMIISDLSSEKKIAKFIGTA